MAVAGYGDATEFREGVTVRHLPYVVRIKSGTSVWPPGLTPLPPAAWHGHGRPPTQLQRTVRWRDGIKGTMRSRFAAARVRPAHCDQEGLRPEEWLLIAWLRGEAEPSEYWLGTVSEDVALTELVRLAKLRWRVEWDFQELKDELGLDHYEGRGRRGFHHHGVLCLAACAFLAAERARLAPRRLWPSCTPRAVPRASGRGGLRRRPERHDPASIATQRWRCHWALVVQSPQCPRRYARARMLVTQWY